MNNHEPIEGDYVLTGCGLLGSSTRVSILGEESLGDFGEMDDALMAVLENMDREQFWPSVWYVNDHGNVSHVPQSWFPSHT